MPVKRIILHHPRVNLRRHSYSSGLVTHDQMFNFIRTSRYPSNSRTSNFQFSAPAKDVEYSTLTLVFGQSRDGLVPKDLSVNHLKPIL